MLQQAAQNVVCDIQSATGRDVELIDVFDRSLAYTALSLHQRTADWMQSGQKLTDSLMIADAKDDYSVLVRQVTLQGEHMGFVALGGANKEELRLLGHTVQWLAQTLLQQYMGDAQQHSPQDLRRSYFESLLFSSQTPREIRLRAVTVGMDPERPLRVAVLRVWRDLVLDTEPQRDKQAWDALRDALQDLCARHTQLTLLYAPEKRILVCEGAEPDGFKGELVKIADAFGARFGPQLRLYGGISMAAAAHSNLRQCYENAAIICDKLASEANPVPLQSECFLDLLMERIPLDTKMEFVTQIFGDCPQADIDEWMRIVDVLTRNNGSINKSAAELYMHKNTLQYRLMRIKERIGLDARASQDVYVLQLAFLARRSIQNSGSALPGAADALQSEPEGFFPIFRQL